MESIDPFPQLAPPDSPVRANWFRGVRNRFQMYSGTADPVIAEVPKNQWILYKNTTSGEIRWWVNDNGTMKKSAAFT